MPALVHESSGVFVLQSSVTHRTAKQHRTAAQRRRTLSKIEQRLASTSPRGECRAWRKITPFAAVASPDRTAGDSKEAASEAAIKTLLEAAETRGIPPSQVCSAMFKLEKQKLSAEDWPQKLGGIASPGRRWRLVFTTGTKKIQDALQGGKGGGSYFPVNAVQRFDHQKQQIENGVFLGHIASLTFIGPLEMTSRKMLFDFNRINFKLGPWKFGFPLNRGQAGTINHPEEGKKKDPGPFFMFSYVDDQICVARGRGGGLALWARTSPVWEAEAGITQA